MTICIAAVTGDGAVVVAADRMITAGDIEFEPNQPKARVITNSIWFLSAGDQLTHTEILRHVMAESMAQVAAAPEVWLGVGIAAETYRRQAERARAKRAESKFLTPLGLTLETFASSQASMAPDVAIKLTTEMINYWPPEVQAICCGLDSGGPQIYGIDADGLHDRSNVGWAAIGSGSWHASSEIMASGFTKALPVYETTLLVYLAKKRAEIAPGVGQATDLYIIGPTLGSYAALPEKLRSQLEAIHQAEEAQMKAARMRSVQEINQYVQTAIDTAATQDRQPADDADGGTPVDP